MSFKYIGEDDTHFHILHPAGHVHKMAKGGVAPEHHDAIRYGLPRHQPVQCFDGGGVAQPAIDPRYAEADAERRAAGLPPGNLQIASAPAPAVLEPRTTEQGRAYAQAVLAGNAPPNQSPSASPAPDVVSQMRQNLSFAPPPAPQQAPGQAPFRPMAPNGVGTSSGTASLIKSATAAEEPLMRQRGLAEQDSAARIQGLAGEKEQNISNWSKETQQLLVDRQAKADSMFEDLKNTKIDPDHFFHTRDTAQKIMGVIGLILGGIGGGKGGGNVALDIINKAIDRDIDAQKANLQKKSSILTYYSQQTHDLVSARQLARADMLDAAAAKIEAEKARFTSVTATTNADISIQELRKQSAGARQEATLRDQNIKLNNITIDTATKQNQALAELYNYRPGQPNGPNPQGPYANGQGPGEQPYTGGKTLSPWVINYLPQETKEKMVRLADGTYAMANTKDDAEAVKRTQIVVQETQQKLKQYHEIIRRHGGGVWNPLDSDFGTADGLRKSIMADFGTLHDLKRLSDNDLQLGMDSLPSIRGPTTDQAIAKIDQFGKGLEQKVWATNRNLLNLHSMPAAPR